MAGPTPGQVLNGRYELRRRIGGGSMGEVWRGRDLVLGRTVAVKIVLPALLEEPTFRARFVAEARVMAMMDHPGIVGVFDYGYADGDDPDTPGAAFLVMEFIEGESLDKVLARTGPLEPRFALKVLASLLDALAAVHRVGVVHRDVKPANVMLTAGGVVLADFGIARSEESLGLTAADALMGTVPYLAPELFQADTPTPAADVYAVGILGYELISGRQPFQAQSTAAVMYKHMHEPPPPLPDYVAAPAAEVLWRALEKDATRRWTDGADMAAAMRRVLAGPVEVGEEYGDPSFGLRRSGSLSGYEDTLTDTGGGRRRARSAAADAGAAGGYGAAAVFEAEAPVDALSDTTGRHGRAAPSEEFADQTAEYEPRSPLDPMSDSVGRHSRPAHADEFAGAAARFDESFADPLDRPDPLSDSGGRHGRAAAFGEYAASDSGGRRGRPAEAPDATRVMDTEPGGRHASPTTQIPLRRRGEGGVLAEAVPSGGRGASPAPRTDAARRRTLVTAAVAAPALLGLTVALVMNSSGSKSPDQGSGVGPGAAQQAGLPSSFGSSSMAETPYASSSSSAYNPHSASGRGRTAATPSTTGSPTAGGTRSSASGAPYSSMTGPSSSATTSAPGFTSTTPSATQPSSTTSSSTAAPVTVPNVVGLGESEAQSKLTGLGFKVQETGKSAGTCTVGDQSLPANSSQPYGSSITLTLNCS